MTDTDDHEYQQIINEIEDAFCSDEDSKWNDIVTALLPDNIIHYPCFDRGFWLTRARHMRDPERKVPYCDTEIGMNKDPKGDTKNRWGKMFYLSTDLNYRAAFNECDIIKNRENATLGFFYIEDSLNLFDATESRAVADSKETICGVEVFKALFSLLYLIDKWFNSSDNVKNERVYQITNHVADLIRTRTNLDGIVYKSTKNKKDTSWNVALVNDNKVKWGYSNLLVPDKLGRYRIVLSCGSNDYEEMVSSTKELLDLESRLKYSYPKQCRSILRHIFPKVAGDLKLLYY